MLEAAVCPSLILASQISKSLEDQLFKAYQEVDSRFNINDEELVMLLDGESQTMYLVDGINGFRVKKSYPVSTSKRGFGTKVDSYKTPTGIHQVKEKIGDGAKIGTIFKSRQNTGRIAKIIKEKKETRSDSVTTRILWLDGKEKHNSNSYPRWIYIHGTPEEGLIGTPASYGCIRMRNQDVIELYNLAKSGTYINIKERLNPSLTSTIIQKIINN